MKKLVLCVVVVGLFIVAIVVFFQVRVSNNTLSFEQVREEILIKQEKNRDMYAWLRIENTKIDYPIMQHDSDDVFYLTHDVNGDRTYYGAIFTERVNQKSFDDTVTIVYGHAMKDESMFGSLKNYLNRAFFNENRRVLVNTAHETLEYDIFAAYVFTDDHLYHTFQLGEPTKIEEYVSHIPEYASKYQGYYIPTDFHVSKDKLLILSTCDWQISGKRYVVHAIKKGE
ncbi:MULTISPECIES: class B sortase [unclassified Granulicatella]|uniref:class B sortase n=1 Tax=unclassified Granulicatella TaxID=2630493 RepID=UPI001074875F|nr:MULTISPECIES: class B sortase [unclassified Granulicatella]MBF0781102.1 class B sortase [Granulicatella sp. 19428wC4_WM01]TFU92033.1 class B sortase [Granulicatella sp. WM01]